ncbi:putative endoribonuclease L-PSP [Variovorax paradoxus B4]|uniref:Putative endoribonuclease L-PSP n=1 Tax=Variovorax paradoxus B4 TaxID=1246301 RepID=T1XLC5_VARPD|nr:RidA family protein [Variovorax paradoxus]AGU53672.1 putative endoribonuclease L-PSP [Variovorax paradoxus B4]
MDRISRVGPPVVRAGQVQPLSAAVVAEGPLVFVSGQVPMRNGQPAAPDIAGQTHAAIDMIEEILARAGCRLEDVVKTTAWLVDGSDYPLFNAAYGERFRPDRAPARSTVLAGLIAPVRVEIEAVAIVRTVPSRQAQGYLPSSAI